MNPTSIFNLGILKVGPSPALNTVLCVSAHQCSKGYPKPGMRTQSQQEAIAYLGCYGVKEVEACTNDALIILTSSDPVWPTEGP